MMRRLSVSVLGCAVPHFVSWPRARCPGLRVRVGSIVRLRVPVSLCVASATAVAVVCLSVAGVELARESRDRPPRRRRSVTMVTRRSGEAGRQARTSRTQRAEGTHMATAPHASDSGAAGNSGGTSRGERGAGSAERKRTVRDTRWAHITAPLAWSAGLTTRWMHSGAALQSHFGTPCDQLMLRRSPAQCLHSAATSSALELRRQTETDRKIDLTASSWHLSR